MSTAEKTTSATVSEIMSTTSKPSKYISYIVLRLLAVIGVLLCIEALLKAFVRSRTPPIHPFPSPALHGPVYNLTTTGTHKDGDKSKAIIAPMLAGEEDKAEWMFEFFPTWKHYIYSVNDPNTNQLTVVKNKGREASVYLTYLITHYETLPDYMVFVHGKRYEWHTDDRMYDTANNVNRFNFSYLDTHGYASLRCYWDPGCPVVFEPNTDPDYDEGFYGIDSSYAKAFKLFFPDQDVPERVGGPCCAQFALSRERVLQRPVSDYERFRQWLWDSDMPGGRSGRVFEFMWHIIFGKEAVHCPDAKQCYCEKFGYCDLDCPSEGECKNIYPVPPAYRNVQQPFPKNFPERGPDDQDWIEWGWWEKDEGHEKRKRRRAILEDLSDA